MEQCAACHQAKPIMDSCPSCSAGFCDSCLPNNVGPKHTCLPATVTIKIVYFKQSGKFYADHTARYEVSLFTGCHSPADVGRKLRELRQLPGIANSTWDGIFMVDFADFNTTKQTICGYPELVIPQ